MKCVDVIVGVRNRAHKWCSRYWVVSASTPNANSLHVGANCCRRGSGECQSCAATFYSREKNVCPSAVAACCLVVVSQSNRKGTKACRRGQRRISQSCATTEATKKDRVPVCCCLVCRRSEAKGRLVSRVSLKGSKRRQTQLSQNWSAMVIDPMKNNNAPVFVRFMLDLTVERRM